MLLRSSGAQPTARLGVTPSILLLHGFAGRQSVPALVPTLYASTFCKLQTNESIDAAEPLYDERRDIINGTKEAPEQPDLKDDEPGWQSGRNQLWGALRTPRDVCLHLRRAVLPTAGSSSSSSCICTATSFGPASPASCQRWLLRSIHVYANSTK